MGGKKELCGLFFNVNNEQEHAARPVRQTASRMAAYTVFCRTRVLNKSVSAGGAAVEDSAWKFENYRIQASQTAQACLCPLLLECSGSWASVGYSILGYYRAWIPGERRGSYGVVKSWIQDAVLRCRLTTPYNQKEKKAVGAIRTGRKNLLLIDARSMIVWQSTLLT